MSEQTKTQDTLLPWITDGTPDAIVERYAGLAAAAAAADYGALDRNVVVIDTETTGFSFNHDELTQIAAARMECGEIVEWFVTFVNPGKPIPEEVAHLTDIHDEDVADAPSPSEALASLAAFVGDALVVAHNADFDRTFTTKHPTGYPLLENTWIDSLDLARIALPRLKSHRLLDLVRAFGAPLSTHRADADVEATCAVLRILYAAVDAMPKPLVRTIADMATEEQWPTSVVFAHFAGDSLPGAEPPALAAAVDTDFWGNPAEPAGAGVESAAALGSVSRETAAGAPAAKSKPFSLRDLRRARLDREERRAKADADDIAADPQRALSFPSDQEIAAAFSKDGLVGRLYGDFEPRAEQAAMAEAVCSAFAAGENLVVEAGTGVGKSMAYLVPSVLTAKANGIAVGVATKTNALLDQLVFHELPALAHAMRDTYPATPPLTWAALKGFSHYPCLRKAAQLAADGPRVRLVNGKEQNQAPAIATLLSYIEQTGYDDIDGLKLDYRLLPRRSVTTTSHDCLRRKCPYFGPLCFVHGARRRAEAADVVVTNHSLLFCDLVADGGLLPPVRYWTIDEAHGAEAEARKAFSLALDAEEIMRLATRVASPEASRNVFVRAERRVAAAAGNEEKATLLYALTNKAKSAGAVYASAANEFAAHMKDLLFFDANRKGKGYETVDLWINDDIRRSATFGAVAGFGRTMVEAAEKLIKASQDLVAYLEEIESAAEVQREIASIAMELKDQVRAGEAILGDASEAYAYAATLSRKKDKVGERLEALLVNVGAVMNETLFARTHATVFASATLSVNGTFAAFEQALGLGASEFSPVRTCMLDSSYDFDANMTVYVASDMPEPNDPAYLPALQQLLVKVHLAQNGSMLTLFTNRREMEKCFEAVQPHLKEAGLRLVCQKWGVSAKGLRDDFLADTSLSLFALKSFWEGFDAPGSTLRGVVIPKLPFAKPTDPLSCERAARDDQAWRRYVLPAAVLETKQAAGRLIRKADDKGALILADRRLISKGYGKAFLNSMPSKTIKVLAADEIAAEIARLGVR